VDFSFSVSPDVAKAAILAGATKGFRADGDKFADFLKQRLKRGSENARLTAVRKTSARSTARPSLERAVSVPEPFEARASFLFTFARTLAESSFRE
jgi:hypothetical protein